MDEPGWAKYWLVQVVNVLEIPGAVLLSFTAHIFVMFFADIRRHKASGVRMVLLWAAYQVANSVAPYALNNISACDDTMSQRQQLLAFWATFLLHNLGGPDNMSALSLEDSSLYRREAPLVLSRVGGAIYFMYKHLHTGSGGGALIPASIMVLVVGAAKYAERAWALWQGDLGKIRGSSKKKQAIRFITGCDDSLISKGKNGKLDDEEALIVAHGMLRFCKRAMSDSSVNTEPPDEGAMAESSVDTESPDNDYDLVRSRNILNMNWESMCSVVEMELSLMYDILYTKAGVIHTSTGVGYIIRIASPLAIVAATVLFGFYYNKECQSTADVIITYILLSVTLVLDTRWLLTALGSTWTHALLQASRPWRCLRHAILCSGRWRRLRHFVVSLDLGRRLRLTCSPRCPSSYRRWSGTTGKYSMLQECTGKISVCGKAAKALGLENIWKEYQHSRGGRKLSQEVKQVVFTRARKVLRSTYKKDKDGSYTMKKITTFWGQVTTERYKEKKFSTSEEEFMLGFGREFQEDILVWHIATKIFLVHAEKKGTLVDAIVVLSEHLMFLMVVNPDMLPGLALRSLYEATLKSLQGVCDRAHISSSRTTAEEKLARILVKKVKKKKDDNHDKDDQWDFDEKIKTRRLVKEGANIAAVLLNQADDSRMQELLELVFNIWVDKLLYAGTRCNRESHAKQLGHGSDLTTIIWIMAEHAGPYRTGQDGPEEKKAKEKPEAVRYPFTPQYAPYGVPADDKPDGPEVAAKISAKAPQLRRTRYSTLYPV